MARRRLEIEEVSALHDLSICLSFAASAFMVAWPLWSIDRSISEAIMRQRRRIHKKTVDEIVTRNNLSEQHFWVCLYQTKDAIRYARGGDDDVEDDEALPFLLAAIGLSQTLGIGIPQAIEKMAKGLA